MRLELTILSALAPQASVYTIPPSGQDLVPPVGFEPTRFSFWERRLIPDWAKGALYGAVSGIRTRTVQILSLLSPTYCTITALLFWRKKVESNHNPYGVQLFSRQCLVQLDSSSMAESNGIEPSPSEQGNTFPRCLVTMTSTLYYWCPRWDSNPHCTASKTAASYQLRYLGMCSPLPRSPTATWTTGISPVFLWWMTAKKIQILNSSTLCITS